VSSPAPDPPPPAPEPAPPGARLYLLFDRILAACVLLAALGLHLAVQAAIADHPAAERPGGAGAESLQELGDLVDAGRARWIAGLALAGLLAGLAALVVLGPRLVRALRAGLARPLAGRVHLAHFLIAFGAIQLAAAPYQGLLPSPALHLEDPGAEAPRELPLGGGEVVEVGGGGADAIAVPGYAGDAPLARVQYLQLGAWVSVAEAEDAPEVVVAGETVAPGGVQEVLPGSALRVGPVDGRLVAASTGAQLRVFSLIKGTQLALLLGGLLVLGGPSLLREVGLTRAGLGREVRRGALAYLAFAPVYVAVVMGSNLVLNLLGVPMVGQTIVGALERDPGLALWVLLMAVVLAPVIEELLFRGILLPGLARPLGGLGGLLAAGLVFGCVHEGLRSLAPLTSLGLLFGALFVASGARPEPDAAPGERSLAGAITAHAIHNGVTVGLILAVHAAAPAGS